MKRSRVKKTQAHKVSCRMYVHINIHDHVICIRQLYENVRNQLWM